MVCFGVDGKFTTTLAKTNSDSEPIIGSYKVSANGKMISQKTDSTDEDVVKVEDDVEIEFLDDKHLIFKIESTTTYFERE